MEILKYILIFFLITGCLETCNAQFIGSGKKNLILKNSILQKIPIRFPVDMKGFKRLSSGYGMRIHPILKRKKFHYGLDLSAKKGTAIYASAAGKITSARYSSSYGNYVIIKHESGYSTLYGHMMKKIVKKNQDVKQGDIIGYVGSTGRSTGPHLHFEIIQSNKKIDPIRFWKKLIKRG
ncbi:M23 family metallopeptidase [Aquimarina sp. RZ0]|uniref:M23 family metallopeptidase n=1 Tax=Aquimarina sp. RZ0 TaxID=2607730 RepID=UPI00165F28ED|nr:M23 family metallopeptidase [Aquimarina sp. RZ0]